MDILKITKKDLFGMKLRDEPVEIDMTPFDGYGKWAEREHLDRLWELGIMTVRKDGRTVCTHRIISTMSDDGRTWSEETKSGHVFDK